MTQRSRVIAALLGLLLLGIALSGCASTPVSQNWPGLTVDNDTVFAISGLPPKVYVLDAETGTEKGIFPTDWSQIGSEPKGAVYWSPVTLGEDLAFVGYADPASKASDLHAFDPETGQVQWSVPTESSRSGKVTDILPAPSYADGVVYFADSAGYVYAVDVEEKRVKAGWPFQAESAVWASPLVADGRVYVAAMDQHLYALDAESGELIWAENVGAAMAAPPILEDGTLYVGAYDANVHAFKADTGERIEGFSFEAGNWIWSRPLMVADELFVTSLDGRLYALDPSTGDVIAPYPYNSGEIDSTDDVIRAAPVQAGEFIIIGTESGRVVAVRDAQRGCVWPTGLPQAGVLTDPVVYNDKLYVILMNGEVYSLDVDTLDAGTCGGRLFWAPPQSD